jgi:hypothetical protein
MQQSVSGIVTMQDNLLTWSIKNWITVFLMFMLAWAVIALGGRLVIGRARNKNGQSQSPAGVAIQ